MELTTRHAWGQFYEGLAPVLEGVIAETNADVVLDRSTTIHTSEDIDKTNDLIAKLDQSMPSINVVKQTLPQQQPQGQ